MHIHVHELLNKEWKKSEKENEKDAMIASVRCTADQRKDQVHDGITLSMAEDWFEVCIALTQDCIMFLGPSSFLRGHTTIHNCSILQPLQPRSLSVFSGGWWLLCWSAGQQSVSLLALRSNTAMAQCRCYIIMAITGGWCNVQWEINLYRILELLIINILN